MNESPIRVWPPCHAFYIHSMLSICESAARSYAAAADALHTEEGRLTDRQFLDQIQNVVQQAGSLSRYFWPAFSRNAEHHKLFQDRGAFLREWLNVTEESPLKNRDLRNQIEHFDENLDLYLTTPLAGHIVPEYVGPQPASRDVPIHFFRAYFPEAGVFEALGKQYTIEPITEEMARIHNALAELGEHGLVFRQL